MMMTMMMMMMATVTRQRRLKRICIGVCFRQRHGAVERCMERADGLRPSIQLGVRIARRWQVRRIEKTTFRSCYYCERTQNHNISIANATITINQASGLFGDREQTEII